MRKPLPWSALLSGFTFNPEDRAEMAEALRLLAAASRIEPGCVSYIPHHVEDDPDTVLIYEQYRDGRPLRPTGSRSTSRSTPSSGLYQKMKDRNRENLIALV